MKRFGWQWLAISSLLLAISAPAEVRPHYGGTLHVAMRATPVSLDPVELGSSDSFGTRSLVPLIFDTLVTMDESGRAQPALAESWQSSHANQRWDLRLRNGVRFTDGTILNADIAAQSLRASNPSWNVSVDGNTLTIQQSVPDPELPAELALARNAIEKRDTGVLGTGPFQVAEWKPGKTVTLLANEGCWRGRPFFDAIEIEMGKGFREQLTAFELRKADLVEVAPEQTNQFVHDGRRVTSAASIELIAVVFSKDASTPEERQLRQALGLSIERGSIRSVLLQGAGEPSGSLLPTSISGYGFVFPTASDIQKARQLRNEVRSVPSWTLGYEGNDSLSRWLAERIALNAKDAGLSLRPTGAGDADARVMRIPVASADPWVALSEAAARLGLTGPKTKGGPVDELYAIEQSALASERVIPLFHLPVCYATAPELKHWTVRADGSWNLNAAWLETRKP